MAHQDHNNGFSASRKRSRPEGFITSKAPKKITAPRFISGFDSGTETSSVAGASGRSSNSSARSLRHVRLGASTPSTAIQKEKRTVPSRPTFQPAAYQSPSGAPEKRNTPNCTSGVAAVNAFKFQLSEAKRPARNSPMDMFRLPENPKKQSFIPLSELEIARPPAPVVPSVRLGFKPISKLDIALSTDPRTESGSAELLSIHLKQHGHGYVDPTDLELSRGLLRSPKKASRYKKQTFVRGGLAESASQILAEMRMSHFLWEKDTQPASRASPDLHLRVLSVLYPLPPRDTPHLNPRPWLIRCRVLARRKNVHVDEEIITILLRLERSYTAPSGGKVSEPKEGFEFHIWNSIKMKVPPSQLPGMPPDITSTDVFFCSQYALVPSPLNRDTSAYNPL